MKPKVVAKSARVELRKLLLLITLEMARQTFCNLICTYCSCERK